MEAETREQKVQNSYYSAGHSKKSERNLSTRERNTEGGWDWMVVFSSFLLYTMLDGTGYSIGVYFQWLQGHFGSSNAETAWLTSVYVGTYSIVGPVAGIIVKNFGCRAVAMSGSTLAAVSIFISSYSPNIAVLIVTFGFLGGVGMGFNQLVSIVSVGNLFVKRRAFATGIVCCGGGVGVFIFAPLLDFLLTEYGMRGTLWIHAAIVLNGLVFSFAYRQEQEKSRTKSDTHAQSNESVSSQRLETFAAGAGSGQDDRDKAGVRCPVSDRGGDRRRGKNRSTFRAAFVDSFDVALMEDTVFLPYWFSVFLWTAGLYIPSTFLPSLARDHDVSSGRAAFLLSIIGIVSTGARLLFGFLSDLPWVSPLLVSFGALLTSGLATALVPLLEPFPLLAAYCVVYGCCIGAFVTLRIPILVELLGVARFTNAYGFLCLAHAAGAFVGAPLAGLLADETGNYSLVFHGTGVVLGVSAIVSLVPLCLIHSTPRRKNTHEAELRIQ